MGKSNLTKTCSSCGLQKPFSAFLQLAGPQGATYGNLCASCRKTNMDKAAASKEGEESTTSTTGHRIGTKERIQAEIDNKERFKKTEERYHEDRDKNAERQAEQHERKVDITAKEEQHRADYLQKHTYSQTTIRTESQRITEARQKALEQAVKQAQNIEHAEKQDEVTQTELKEKEVKVDNAGGVMRVAGKVSLSGVYVKAFAAWLGKDSPFARALEQPSQKADQGARPEENETENADRKWGPDSKRRPGK
jgi:hypothetical protein